ncbi:MAG: hypothetical protein IJB57_04100 [Clostridia bacterium]|nr:hypothetical protein [Clostridia bacterium]
MNAFNDPVYRAMFGDETLELGERAGLAYKNLAEEMPVYLTNTLLPYARMISPTGGGCISYDAGVDCDRGRYKWFAEQNPEDAEDILYCCEKFKSLTRRSQHVPFNEEARRMADAGAGWGGTWGGHSNPDFGLIVNEGTEGIRRRIEAGKAKEIYDSDWFYRGCEYTMDALDTLGEKFRIMYTERAAAETNPVNKKWCENAAKAFEVIPKNPAYDFESAVLAFMLVFSVDGYDSPGRFDQYMYRCWIAEQDEEVRYDALERLWDEMHDKRAWNLCLCGSDENWNDQTNELSYEILKIAREKKYQTPNITLRVNRNTPEEMWQAIAETEASGIGMPALYNDEVVCPSLEAMGIPPHHSHMYCMNGCNQIDIFGKSHMGLEDAEVNMGKCLELALHNGVDTCYLKEVVSFTSGDATKFTSYEEVENAFMQQMEYATYIFCLNANTCQQMRGFYGPNPLRSCLIEGCLEKGRDYRNGGPLYNHGQILAEGLADAGDSLYAIKKLVFEEKKYTMAELIRALDDNFEGHDALYRDFSTCSKFGCDIEEVDKITAKIFNRFSVVAKRNNTYRGGVFATGCSPFSRAADHAHHVAALPNGKKFRATEYADCIGATPGNDTKGPTALINSVLHYNQYNTGSGMVFQTKFDKELFNTDEGKAAFIALAKTYFAGGGQQFVTCVVSHEELLDAQIHPEKHQDLIVRVGGYSDYFVNISKELQDNVIRRTYQEI